jgi:hypothetical protein
MRSWTLAMNFLGSVITFATPLPSEDQSWRSQNAGLSPLILKKRRYSGHSGVSSSCRDWTPAPQEELHHSITSSAIASIPAGMVRPSVLAVLRLIMNSNFVGCSTGKSAGLAPFSILST